MNQPIIFVRGAGDLATGVLYTLWNFGYSVVAAEAAAPSSIRRTVSLSEAVYEGRCTVENVTTERCDRKEDIPRILAAGSIPLLVDPQGEIIPCLKPDVVVDAIIAKRNLGTHRGMADAVIGLGPGFTAGVDVHAVVETARGHDLGRVILSGAAQPNTGIPGIIGGVGQERVIYAPAAGRLHTLRQIGDHVEAGEVIAEVDGTEIRTQISGTLRGILRDGFFVTKGFKTADVDPRDVRGHCYTISDKARLIGYGVLHAIRILTGKQGEILC